MTESATEAPQTRPGIGIAASADQAAALCWAPSDVCPLVTELLSMLPARRAHSLLAGRQALAVLETVPAADRDLLVSAALLHDIGYSPYLSKTGFHPLDGANYLLTLGAPERLAALVAHHSESGFLAAANGNDLALS